MERQSTGEAGIDKDYYEVIDILADTNNTKLKFFVTAKEAIELAEEDFDCHLTEDGKFKVNYREDGIVEIYAQINADRLLDIIRIRDEVGDKVGDIIPTETENEHTISDSAVKIWMNLGNG